MYKSLLNADYRTPPQASQASVTALYPRSWSKQVEENPLRCEVWIKGTTSFCRITIAFVVHLHRMSGSGASHFNPLDIQRPRIFRMQCISLSHLMSNARYTTAIWTAAGKVIPSKPTSNYWAISVSEERRINPLRLERCWRQHWRFAMWERKLKRSGLQSGEFHDVTFRSC